MMGERPDNILKILCDHGHEAYYVGGCVRDILLGRPVHDWDITTSAQPEQVMACFEKCVPTGIRHGTVTVIEDGVHAEVTTYRTDGAYADGRHPEKVRFVRTLAEDLARRDFTVNAMAMDRSGEITDLYQGRQHLDEKIICCVGDPDFRFREDALRMLRAVRFSAQLGFAIEKNTAEAIARNAELAQCLSAERVRDEVEKTICSQRPQMIEDMVGFGLLNRFAPPKIGDCAWLAKLPAEPVIRWAALCRSWPALDLSQMRLSKKVTLDASAAGRCSIPTDRLGWKKMIASEGLERTYITAALAGQTDLIRQIENSGECISIKHLAVNGADFPELSGPELGARLQWLLYHVLAHPQDNIKEVLKELHG